MERKDTVICCDPQIVQTESEYDILCTSDQIMSMSVELLDTFYRSHDDFIFMSS